MTTTFTVKQVPTTLADALRARAAKNRRSLQRELLLILETSVAGNHAGDEARRSAEPPAPAYAAAPRHPRARSGSHGKLTLQELWQRARKLGTPSRAESADIIRRERDGRHGR